MVQIGADAKSEFGDGAILVLNNLLMAGSHQVSFII